MHSIQGLSPRVLLVILDGFGQNPSHHKNAIYSAKKPNIDNLFAHYPFTTIQPGGEAVGLPKGVAGNSEVGHINLGAGRPVRQDLVRINEVIANKTLKDMPKMKELIEKPEAYILNEYKKGIFDEFITPALFVEDGAIQNGDSVFFINYRPDRARELTLAMNETHFKEFPVPVRPGYFLCMSPYVQEECPNLPILFDKEKVKGTLSEYLSTLGKKQFKIAETEKYAHVTYFFNGGEEKPFPGEERCLVPSPREVATYDQKPEMSAFEVTDKLSVALSDKSFSFYLVNFANADMVGHTGNFAAAVRAVEALDECVAKLEKKCEAENITMIITADHGNADQMAYEDEAVHTSHSDSEVPFCVVHAKLKDIDVMPNNENKVVALKDVAPTVLKILNLPKPKDFSGQPIFV